jgi:epoxyqueuosine reductase QueG
MLFPEENIIVPQIEETSMERARNSQRVETIFSELAKIGYEGVVGATAFRVVYARLNPVQKNRLKDICGRRFQHLRKDGSIICVGIAYPERVIDCIDVRSSDGTIDRNSWNVYAREYHRLNVFLNDISKGLAERFDGIRIPATIEGIAVTNVEEYYGRTVSHRVIAENAGLGWRGKNDLIVNSRFSCALRFASVIVDLPLVHGKKARSTCGECQACLETCSFLRDKNRLENYRENCRKYIAKLGLEGEVCGKCIKACYRHSIFSNEFKLR